MSRKEIDTSRQDKVARYPLGTRHVDGAGQPWLYVHKASARGGASGRSKPPKAPAAAIIITQ